jgi:N utilization substance protein B
VLRAETKTRARALQMLYAWELKGRPAMDAVAAALPPDQLRAKQRLRAEQLAVAIAGQIEGLDRDIADAAQNWRLERIGAVERNILRLGLHELHNPDLPAPVAIDEAVKLAHWFAGPKAPAFVNGVLDGLARRLGRL